MGSPRLVAARTALADNARGHLPQARGQRPVVNGTSTGSGSFGSTDRHISLFVDPAHGDLLGVDVAFTLTEKNAGCNGLVANGSSDDLFSPSCGDAVADAAGHGRLLGIPKASGGTIAFTCSGPTIHQGVGSGTITVSGSLTRP